MRAIGMRQGPAHRPFRRSLPLKPNLNQTRLNGTSSAGLTSAAARNAPATPNAQTRGGPPFSSGNRPMAKNTTAKTTPKPRSDHRRRHGFDNLDFRFGEYRLPLTERPVAVRELPDYAIARIRTGQYLINEDGSFTKLWEGEVHLNE